MKHSILVSALMLGASSLPSVAFDFGNGLSATGEVEIEYFDADGDSETLAYGSADLTFRQPGGAFGGFIGLDAIAISGDSESIFYGALTYTADFGNIQIGAPRPVVDDYFDAPVIGGARIVDLIVPVGRSFRSTILTLGGNLDTPAGIRYDGTFGNLQAGASYNRFDGGDIIDAAARLNLDTVSFSGSVERLADDGNFAQTIYNIGAEARLDKLTMGAIYTSLGMFDQSATQIYAIYSLVENLDLAASYMVFDSAFGGDDAFGLSAKYGFTNGLYAEAGFSEGVISDELYTASVGISF
ncbi:hypothetical protein HYN69_08490 [Gemmobacter aquarius]|uniref:Porin n=1 Tax=Paragemmobacter aquarius TaxID=2169400 RepID=A0A2S0UL43_9RHOB|nr:hypothetical protein [Gemmobacter aquarius]AWB48544.1 hypothetical protein HYN69_08490 [Gemmobacter aquarius]